MMTKNIMIEKRIGKASLGNIKADGKGKEKHIGKPSLGNRKMHWKDKEKRIGKPSLGNIKTHWKDKHLGNKIQIINCYIFTFTIEINE